MKKATRHDNRPFVPLRRANESPLNIIPDFVMKQAELDGLKRLYPATRKQEQKFMDVVAKLWDIINLSAGSAVYPIAGLFVYDPLECTGIYGSEDVVAICTNTEYGSPRGYIGLDVHTLDTDSQYIAYQLMKGVSVCLMGGGSPAEPVVAKCTQYFVTEFDKANSTNVAQYFDDSLLS